MKPYFAFAIILTALTSFAVSQEQEQKQAEASAQTWLGLIDKGDYNGSWKEAASMFKSAVPQEKWSQMVGSSRGQFGKLISRKLKSTQYTTTLPGAPDGKYVVIQYDTSFENKKSALETITPMLDKDGQWRVSGYFIR
jgi:hypothetical protein